MTPKLTAAQREPVPCLVCEGTGRKRNTPRTWLKCGTCGGSGEVRRRLSTSQHQDPAGRAALSEGEK